MAQTHIVSLQAPFKPAPSFDSCTPISNNQFTGDDPNDMPFIPLADDPSFDWKTHCEKYKSFSWGPGRVFDSDCELILHARVVETAHRLHQQYGLSHSEIDDTAVLPLPLVAAQGGVLHTTRYQGFLNWTGANAEDYKPSPAPRSSTQAEFKALLGQFCNSSSCMIGFCDPHINWFPMPPSLPVTPRLSSDDLFYDALAPCGEDCFISRVPGNMLGMESSWTTKDIDTFNILLEYSPDTSPCDLAIVCKKPCFEVFKRRKSLLPDQNIRKKPSEKNARRILPLKANMFNGCPNPPCYHQGACDATANCACFKNGAHCERSCRCDLKNCRRRWPGCNCVRTRTLGRPCGTDRCSCFRAHRECDPELCGKCEARDQFNDTGCLNVSIQREYRKSTETKSGSWGLGLFLLEPAEPGELITEYLGELIYELTTESRDDVSTHRRRNYLFDLNAGLALDGEFAGNESRYINHSENSNCKAQVMIVNGNHRIGIYASTHIEAGVELFINYGTQFFKTA
ncbi:SET domain-containing protein [Gymnopus androsaceus JB14]|uniref:SET domain-containing protein n=1 Tax=Gymnopus androsaceus JB14 TaxID=1447944 RepID=A0A6A4HK41_9AGAR|nr:SET domain-containing protein [Gymnopus androsaceus JB14]